VGGTAVGQGSVVHTGNVAKDGVWAKFGGGPGVVAPSGECVDPRLKGVIVVWGGLEWRCKALSLVGRWGRWVC